MVKANLASMSVEALLQLRDNVGRILSGKADEVQQQLAALGDGGWISSAKKMVGRPRGSSLKGRKVAAKYRNPNNRAETWAGRGAMPRWLAAEIKQGKNREDFAINKSAAKAKRAPVKRSRRKKK
jgi:DNA-binding protein H-NS